MGRAWRRLLAAAGLWACRSTGTLRFCLWKKTESTCLGPLRLRWPAHRNHISGRCRPFCRTMWRPRALQPDAGRRCTLEGIHRTRPVLVTAARMGNKLTFSCTWRGRPMSPWSLAAHYRSSSLPCHGRYPFLVQHMSQVTAALAVIAVAEAFAPTATLASYTRRKSLGRRSSVHSRWRRRRT